ncbi:MAG: T9SS type A sorting domain-containing protein [candidate division Zixibacteria bacterium]|nr:T9SS type A sorting domain-containing protein [candidate division Zixibacteria bacterium]
MEVFMKSIIITLICSLIFTPAVLGSGVPQEKPYSGVVQYSRSLDNSYGFNQLEEIRLFSNIGPNVRANQDTSGEHQNETTIAVNPLNPYNLVGGANDYRNGEVDGGYYYTFDGGQSWGDGTLCCWPDLDAQGDPAVTCDADGNFYFAVISFDRGTDDNGIYVSKSTDGGVNWGDPVAVIEHIGQPGADFEDKEYIAADITDSPYRNNVYVSWTSFSDFYPIEFSRSTDGGVSFSSAIEISDYDFNQGSVPAVGPNGEVYVVWFAYDSPNYIRIDKSTDGGVSWGNDIDISRVTPLPSPLPPTAFRVNSFPSIAVDVTGGQYNGYIHVVWAGYENNDADVYYSRSTDGGMTWSPKARLNDDPIGNGADQFFPWISCDNNGLVHVFFYDRRNDNSNILIDGYYTRSEDGGASWSSNERVTTTSFDPYIGFGGGFIGDYNGITSSEHRAHPLWTDTRLGNQDAFYAQIDWDNVPPVNIAMVPDNPPITIPAGGGSFTFTGVLGNNRDFDINGDVWIMLTLPGGGEYGPLTVYRGIPLTANDILYYDAVNQDVPSFAPSGEYRYRAYAGLYPSFPIDSASFGFTKTSTGIAGAYENWATSGWFNKEDYTAGAVPSGIQLIGNYPNPFNAETNIEYLLSEANEVQLDIYNIRGQKVESIEHGYKDAGKYIIKWDASNSASGIYYYRLSSGEQVITGKMTLLK